MFVFVEIILTTLLVLNLKQTLQIKQSECKLLMNNFNIKQRKN